MKLWATDGTSNWFLWRIPDLRGRIAYDVRFELYDEQALDQIIRYGRRNAGWEAVLDGYDVVVVDDRAHLEALNTGPGANLDDEIAVVNRAR